ncbi:MAG: hypothetical protein KDA41_14375 [Planctomycetales bacterium]|nr:hypothetical protein [Planctomycetales bacterium]
MQTAKIAFLALVVAGPSAAADIDWEVANRFRLFKSEAQFRAIAAIYDSLPADARRNGPSLALETELEQRAAEKRLGRAFGDPTSVARYGWAASVVAFSADNRSGTCFQDGNHGHFPCKLATGDQFLTPRKFDLVARARNLDPGVASRPCVWKIGASTVAAARCGDEVRFTGLPYDQSFSISVSDPAGGTIAGADNQNASVLTILGLGDSFASGEGNPDRAAVLGNERDSYDRSSKMPGTGYRAYPLRPGASETRIGAPYAAAIWLSAQCHRSLYSQQTKAALTIALEQKHRAVNFLGYGCTGAAVDAGLLGYWAARDDVRDAYYDASPQIMRALRDICADKAAYDGFEEPDSYDWRTLKPCAHRRVEKIDALLLSIGGNDIGFANVIANETVDSGNDIYGLRTFLYRFWLAQTDPIPLSDALQTARSKLPKAYADLAEALHRYLGVQGGKIVQTAYPQLTRVSETKVCGVSTDGMDVHEILGLRKSSTGADAAVFVDKFNALIAKAIDTLPAARRWRLAMGHVERFVGHAICMGGALNGGDAGRMQFPIFDNGAWRGISPGAWAAYRPKTRWFVTPNDSFLTANYMNIETFVPNARDRAQPLVAATLGGSFHPNALGHAAVADGALPELRAALGLPEPQ